MDLFLKWLAFAGIQAMATVSPGPAFAVAVRSALVHGRRTGVFLAIGLGLGVAAHVFLVLTGVAFLFSRSVFLFDAVRLAGAAYLIYIGIKALRAQKRVAEPEAFEIGAMSQERTGIAGIRAGFLTNLLNPKAIVFFTAVLTQFIESGTSMPVLFLYGATSVIIEITWFVLLTLFLTDVRVRNRFLSVSHWIERICGGFLLLLGIRLSLSKM
jgi:RhtB (resistance to homoserine/threonine) family protein